LLVVVVVVASRKKKRIEGFGDFVGCVLQQFQKFRVCLDAVKAAWRFHDGKSKTLVLKFCLEKSSMTVFFAHVSKSLAEYELLRLCTILFFSMFTNQTFFWSFQVAIPLFPKSYFFLAVIVAGLKHAQINGESWKYDFRIDVKSLAQMVGGQDTKALEDNNGVDGVAEKLQTSLCDGLCSDAIYKTLEAFGTNTYTEVPPKPFWVFVLEAWHDMTLIILSICAIVSLAIGIPTEGWEEGWYDGAGIAFSVFLVVFVTAVSDYQQSLQFRDLDKEKKKIFVDVTRDKCRQKICIFDLLVGDIVHLKIGDQVPADGLYVSGSTVMIDESSMTGESQPSIKDESKPFLLSGTKVQDGSGKMLVTGVGMNTEWGHLMAKLGEEDDDETPLQVKLCGVATLIGQIGVGFAVLTFLVLLGRFLYAKESLKVWSLEDAVTTVDYFAIAVTIVVVAVPEGLPLAVTLTLAFAMKKMMADKALVRHLSACETMGSATTICSDKTGTLTSNKMNVVKAWAAGSVYEEFGKMKDNLPVKLVHTLVEGAFINSDGDISENKDGLPPSLLGTPTDTAILGFGLKLGGNFQEVHSKCEVVKMEPFNSKRKMMGVVVKHPENGELIAHWKGASEIVLQLCDRTIDANGSIVKLDEQKREHLNGVITTFADEALRTLCLAFRRVEVIPGSNEPIPNEGFVLVSIVGIKDPLRPGAKEAVRLCREAGIKVRMVTGDNLHTAMAIARECGILIDDREAIEGPEFRKLLSMDPVAMEERIRKLQVNLKSSTRIQYCIVISRKKLMLTQNEYLHPFLVVSM
jgi:Ca2+-transporting ATPase